MAAIGTTALEDLLAEASEVGITAEQVAALLRLRVDSLEVMSGRDRSRVELELIEPARQRRERKARQTMTPAQRADLSATDRQVDYIASLLRGQVRSGDGGGFVATKGLIEAGRVRRDEVAKLTRTEASTLIDSLRNDY